MRTDPMSVNDLHDRCKSDAEQNAALSPVRSKPLLAALRTLERSFRQRSAYSHSRAKKNSDHGQYLIGIHVGICADDLRDLIKQHTANIAVSGGGGADVH